MRQLITIDCAGATLGATLDPAPGQVGLLLVPGGTQTRIGAHRGLQALARAVAAAGFSAFRYDRRGVGDSDGDDPGFIAAGPDLAAAAAAFRRACPHVTHILGFGLCDGATALALHHRAAGLDGLILANPWVVEAQAGLPPPAAIRRRYADRLFSLSAWKRLLTGGIDYRAAARGLASLARRPAAASLAATVSDALAATGRPATIVLATGDATAIAFDAEYSGSAFAAARAAARITFVRMDTSSHSFAAGTDPDRLAAICIAALVGFATEPTCARQNR